MGWKQLAGGAARGWILCLCGLFAVTAISPSAWASRVTLLSRAGRASVVNDPYLPRALPSPEPSQTASAAAPGRTGSGGLTVVRRLAQLAASGSITAGQHRSYLRAWQGALRTERRLRGTRAAELESVIANLHDVAAAHALAASRLPALFLTLRRNVQWWTRGSLLRSGQRVEFAGSQLVWQYYPGQGVELQELGSFGKADGLYTAGRAHYGQLQSLLGELIPLAVPRAGGLAWEYYFHFDGGRPPWVSAMAQGTALEALTRAYRATGNPAYLTSAHAALGILTHKPGTGVAVPEAYGTRFLQYSFAPNADIINAFLQTLIGLYDYAKASGDAQAERLFTAGNGQAQAELPHFDTGAWSLYEPGLEDTLSYHELVTGFLTQLCQRTQAPAYCQTAARFKTYLHTPPAVTLLTQRATARRAFALRFRLSKVSHVGVVLLRGSRTLLATSATFPHGVRRVSVAGLTRGTYAVHLAATDPAGNFQRTVGTLTVRPRRKRG